MVCREDRVEFGETADVVLEGVLLPVGWGASGEVVDVTLMTFDEDEYPIDPDAARTHNLLDHLRQSVRLEGVVRYGRVIRVTGIRLA